MAEDPTIETPREKQPRVQAESPVALRGPSPVRWAAAGLIGGVSIMGMLWSILGRAPAPIEPIASSPPNVPAIVQPVPAASEPNRAREYAARDDRSPSFASIERDPISSISSDQDREQDQQFVQRDTGRIDPPTTEPAQSRTPTLETLTERLNINRATQAELELLPNIGPTLAGRIIAFRESEGPIRSLTHLTDVRGIGVRTAEAIEPYVRFD